MVHWILSSEWLYMWIRWPFKNLEKKKKLEKDGHLKKKMMAILGIGTVLLCTDAFCNMAINLDASWYDAGWI